MPVLAIHDIHQIDLDRHGLIEASAGTGKTYTIENLVVRLLVEKPGLLLENILLVTFTEKATSELKVRIREKLEQTLSETLSESGPDTAKETAQRLGAALDAFDTAPIHTIHGFCHTLLNDFAFENDILFQTERVDDRPLYEKALREQMRSVWPQRYGRWLPQLLAISGFSKQPSTYLDTLIRIAAGGFNPAAGDRLFPDPEDVDLSDRIDRFGASVATLTSLAGPATGFTDAYQQLNFHAGSRKAIVNKVIRPLGQWLETVDPRHPDLTGFDRLLGTMEGYQKFKDGGPDVIVPQKYNGGHDNSSEVCPGLGDVVTALKDTLRTYEPLRYIVAVESIRRLGKDVRITKQSRGWISYDDMLKQVHATLTGPSAGRLLAPLRKQYHYAFVDEFQDTDPIQWQIFERIFIESDTNRLFLIGDPKQAIYSFRGADVFTYLSARYQLEKLAEKGRAARYFLNVNWRSTPSLVAGFNRIFSAPPWFGPPRAANWHEITYLPAVSPDEVDLPEKIVRDTSGRKALNIIDLRGPRKPSLAAADLARFIAREIRFLITGERIVMAEKNDLPRPLDPGDICILVRGRKDALLMEAELSDHQIPYSYYRKPGLFASDEAYYLSVVFRAILSPTDGIYVKKALLTPFFRFQADDLYACDDLPVSHPVRHLFLKWHQLAQYRYWGELFQSMIVETGLIFREAATAEWDRAETNYHQIFACLGDIAYRKNLNFDRLCSHLDGYRQQTLSAESDADIHEIETEQRKVQIMTMHRAKGLQFPVVFIAGGLTQGRQTSYHTFHRIDADHPGHIDKVIDLTQTADPDQYRQEVADEDKRLLYVALTRAQFKLYVPFFPALNRQPHFGPVCRFMAQAIDEVLSDTPDSEEVAWLGMNIHFQAPVHPAPLQDMPADRDLPPALLPTDTYFGHRTTAVASFSSIHEKKRLSNDTEAAQPATIFGNDPTVSREDDERVAGSAVPISQPLRPADEIPGGPDVGSMFHDILEHIDFNGVTTHPRDLLETDGSGNLIRRYMTQYGLDRQFEPHVARVIADTLTTPIPQVGNAFTLGSLTPEDRRHEIAFYYTVPSSPDQLIRGVVDLVFRYEGAYYIADWKSNYLADGYAISALSASMDVADYRLQYQLYTVAVLRWLHHALGDRFDPRRHFGGVFYFYLRGMGMGPDHGIYFVSPDEIGSLTSLEKTLFDHE